FALERSVTHGRPRRRKRDDQIPFRHFVAADGRKCFRTRRPRARRLRARCLALLPCAYERGRSAGAGLPQPEPRPPLQGLRQGADRARTVVFSVIARRRRKALNPERRGYVLLPAALATTGSTSFAARSGVSSFQRTEPNGRSSMRRMRTGSGPKWKSIAF